MFKAKILVFSCLSTISLTSCYLLNKKTEEEKIPNEEKYNPATLAEEQYQRQYFEYKGIRYTLNEFYGANTTFTGLFKQIKDFENVTSKEELANDYTDVYLKTIPEPFSIGDISTIFHLKIYSDGYVISYNPHFKGDDPKSGDPAYYYQFDESKSDIIFEKVHFVHEESLRIEKEKEEARIKCEAKKKDFTFQTVLDEFSSIEYFAFCSKDIKNTDPYAKNFFKIENNESITKLVKGAKYSETTFDESEEASSSRSNYFRFEHVYEPGNYYTFEMREGENIVRIQYRLVDSFRRNYDKDFAYSIDRTSAQNIFDIFVKYAEEHPSEAQRSISF